MTPVRAWMTYATIGYDTQYMGFGLLLGLTFKFNVDFFSANMTIFFGFAELILGPHWVDPDEERYVFRVMRRDGRLQFLVGEAFRKRMER